MLHNFIIKPLVQPFQAAFALFIGLGGAIVLGWLGLSLSGHYGLKIALLIPACIFLLCAIVALTGYVGIAVDMNNREWITYTGLLGFRVGLEKSKFPEGMDYILIFTAEFIDNNTPINGNQEMYEVSVVYGDRRQTFGLVTAKTDANKVANRLGSIMGLEIVDRTLKEGYE